MEITTFRRQPAVSRRSAEQFWTRPGCQADRIGQAAPLRPWL